MLYGYSVKYDCNKNNEFEKLFLENAFVKLFQIIKRSKKKGLLSQLEFSVSLKNGSIRDRPLHVYIVPIKGEIENICIEPGEESLSCRMNGSEAEIKLDHYVFHFYVRKSEKVS